MRILAAGQLVEDIDNYNRIHEIMRLTVANENRENDAAKAFGQDCEQKPNQLRS